MEEQKKFLIGGEVARNESSQTACTSHKRKSQKRRCKYTYTNSAVHFTCNAHVHVNSNWYPCSGDKENQNPKWVKTVTKTAASTGVHVACSSTCCTYLHVYFRSI